MIDLSIVIPIHNEKEILENEVRKLTLALETAVAGRDYEILLVENGSSDKTPEIASNLSRNLPKIRVIALQNGDYGAAMKEGILQSRGQYAAIFNIDFWDIEALKKTLYLFENEKKDVVVCSKAMRGAQDRRSWKRRALNRIYNLSLRVLFNYRGTETHGIKFLRLEPIIPILKKCWTSGAMLDTELLLRAQDAGLKIAEIPVICEEKRKSVFGLSKHLPRVFKDTLALFIELRLKI
ncbi:MAG: glycosyltransferase [Candidatus Niyogibacteria bacterium]|nr:MAG: glycosyltransferase [Candidatus Niyogibacteria bacterium]